MPSEREQSGKTIAHVIYGLYATSIFIGITGLIGVIIAHVKRGDLRGTYLESHLTWQIRTFWFSLLWAVIGLITIFAYIGWLILLATGVWVIYRVVKGWLRLVDNKAMYV